MAESSQTYKYEGAFDFSGPEPDSSLEGKTAIITGGSQGIGAEYVRVLTKAGANVCIGDLDEEAAMALQKEIGDQVNFSKCDVTKWDDLVTLFRTALKHTGRVDIVVANAGVSGRDSIAFPELSEDRDTPTEPNLSTIDINLKGVAYTTKLALHHFYHQHKEDPSAGPTNLVLGASLASYVAVVNSVQYVGTKFALRGMMTSLRYTSLRYNTHVSCVCPWYTRTRMIVPLEEHLAKHGVGFIDTKDVARALMWIVREKKLHGRAIAVVPKDWSDSGLIDIDEDDHTNNKNMAKLQQLLFESRYQPKPQL